MSLLKLNNTYKLDNDNFNLLKNTINTISNDKIKYKGLYLLMHNSSICLLLSEIKEMFVRQKDWNNLVYKYMVLIKKELDMYINYVRISNIDGLCEVGYAVLSLSQHTNFYDFF